MINMANIEEVTLGAILEQAKNGPLVLMREGQPVFILEPCDLDDFKDYLNEHNPTIVKKAQQARIHLAQGKGKTLSEIKANIATRAE